VWTLLAALVLQIALSAVVIWGGAPLGAVACVLAVVAMVYTHDRGLLLWLLLVVGLLLVVFPFAFWVGG
jgi:hypothetical protein